MRGKKPKSPLAFRYGGCYLQLKASQTGLMQSGGAQSDNQAHNSSEWSDQKENQIFLTLKSVPLSMMLHYHYDFCKLSKNT